VTSLYLRRPCSVLSRSPLFRRTTLSSSPNTSPSRTAACNLAPCVSPIFFSRVLYRLFLFLIGTSLFYFLSGSLLAWSVFPRKQLFSPHRRIDSPCANWPLFIPCRLSYKLDAVRLMTSLGCVTDLRIGSPVELYTKSSACHLSPSRHFLLPELNPLPNRVCDWSRSIALVPESLYSRLSLLLPILSFRSLPLFS